MSPGGSLRAAASRVAPIRARARGLARCLALLLGLAALPMTTLAAPTLAAPILPASIESMPTGLGLSPDQERQLEEFFAELRSERPRGFDASFGGAPNSARGRRPSSPDASDAPGAPSAAAAGFPPLLVDRWLRGVSEILTPRQLAVTADSLSARSVQTRADPGNRSSDRWPREVSRALLELQVPPEQIELALRCLLAHQREVAAAVRDLVVVGASSETRAAREARNECLRAAGLDLSARELLRTERERAETRLGRRESLGSRRSEERSELLAELLDLPATDERALRSALEQLARERVDLSVALASGSLDIQELSLEEARLDVSEARTLRAALGDPHGESASALLKILQAADRGPVLGSSPGPPGGFIAPR